MALKSIMLMILAVGILVVPGMLYNNLNNNGLVVAQGQSLNCSSDAQTPTCQISGNVGCQASSAYCTLSGSSISFLSHTSVFTNLISGNIFALFSGLNNQKSAPIHGPWDFLGGTNVMQGRANCIVDDAGGKSLTKWQFTNHPCTQANSDTSNMTLANSDTWNNWNANLLGTSAKAIHFFQLKSNASGSFACNYNFQLNYTTGGSNTGYTWYGCLWEAGIGSVKTDREYGLWFAVPRELGALNPAYKFGSGAACAGGNCYHENLQFAMVSWDAALCSQTSAGNVGGNNQYFVSTECNQFWSNLNSLAQTAGGSSQAFGLLSPLIVWVIGLVLLFIGLGIGFGFGGSVLGTGTQGGVSENEAGTRLAQSLGIGLLVWTPLYSEFSTWFTSGLLPYGLDGPIGIIALLLTGMFFFGVFWRALSRD